MVSPMIFCCFTLFIVELQGNDIFGMHLKKMMCIKKTSGEKRSATQSCLGASTWLHKLPAEFDLHQIN
jgi:hypothetical protein